MRIPARLLRRIARTLYRWQISPAAASVLLFWATRLHPRDADAWLDLGIVQCGRRRYAEAKATGRAGLEHVRDDLRLRELVGRTCWFLQQWDEAESTYRELLKADPVNATGHWNLAQILFYLNRLDEAETEFRTAIKVGPHLSGGYEGLGRVLEALKRDEEAEAVYRDCIQRVPHAPEGYFQLGLLLKRSGRAQEAKSLFEQAVQLATDDHMLRGNLLAEVGRYREAQELFHYEITLNPNEAFAYRRLGYVLHAQGRGAEAAMAYRQAVRCAPSNPDVWFEYGQALMIDGQLPEADNCFNRAWNLDGTHSYAVYGRAMICSLQGNPQAAMPLVSKLVDLAPDQYWSLLLVAAIHKELGYSMTAAEYVSKARNAISEQDWYTLAQAESIAGNVDLAIANLKRAAEQSNFMRMLAQRDPCLRWIRDDPRFTEIVGKPGTA